MAAITKHTIGIDISMNTFRACYGFINQQGDIKFLGTKDFNNSIKGFKKLLRWTQKVSMDKALPLNFVMEATGVYYENLAFFLDEQKQNVVVLLPNKAKHFIQSYNKKTKTDAIDAKMLTQMGLERSLQQWKAPGKTLREVKHLVREYNTVKELLTKAQNQLHAKQRSHDYTKSSLKRTNQQIDFYTEQLKAIEKDIKKLINDDPDIKERIDKVETIQGIGFMTAITVIAETDGFENITNNKQLLSYAGLDITHNESGKHKGRTTISKRGNTIIRTAMYMPALSASRCNKTLKEFYQRMCETLPAKKMAIIAVARKLLIYIYSIYKNNVPFDPDYRKA